MKLWQKIFIITLAFVMIAVSATAVFLAQGYFSSAIRQERVSAEAQHEYYAANITNKISYERIKSNELVLSDSEIKSAITDMLSSYSGFETGIAVYNESSEIDSIRSDVLKAVPNLIKKVKNNDDEYSVITDFKEKTYLIIGSQITLEGQSYYIFTTTDITLVYTNHETAMNYIKIFSIVFAVVTAMILLVVVYRLLQPLTRVNSLIKQIADGDYEVRVYEKGGSEFKELASNVNIMAEAIESNVQDLRNIADSRKRFIDNLAHEMKTPLTSIICFADVLRIKRDITDNELRDYSGIIVEEAKRLKGLSGKLLELTVAGNAELEIRDINISELLDEIENSVKPIIKKRGMRLVITPVNALVRVDRDLFISLLYNLIDNAVKASDDGQKSEIKCALNSNKLIISVIDNGVGMSEDDIRKITEPFYMVDKSRSRKAGGAGLGLSLCAEIVRQHNAKLQIDSALGTGTTVSVIMPTGGSSDE